MLIALRDPLAGIGLGVIVDGAADMRCAGVLARGESIRDAVTRTRPRVLVLDVRHRRADPALIPDLARARPSTRILIMVDHTAEECALKHLMALRTGSTLSPEAMDRLDDCCLTSLKQDAHGCLGQEPEPEVVLRAVRTVAAGEVAAAPWVKAVAERVRNRTDPRAGPEAPPAITERELEVMACLAEGLTNAAIADRLGLREQTVKNHIAKAMHKLGTESRLEVGLQLSRHNVRLHGPREGGPPRTDDGPRTGAPEGAELPRENQFT